MNLIPEDKKQEYQENNEIVIARAEQCTFCSNPAYIRIEGIKSSLLKHKKVRFCEEHLDELYSRLQCYIDSDTMKKVYEKGRKDLAKELLNKIEKE